MADKINRHDGVVSCHGSGKVLQLLGALQKTPSGNILYQQIDRILSDANYTQERITRGYAALALVLLDTYRRHMPKSSLLYLELKLIQQRLMPPVSIAELASLQAYIKKASKLINEIETPDADIIRDALSPLLGHAPASEKQEPRQEQTDIPKEKYPLTNCDAPFSSTSIDRRANSVYRHKLDQQRQEMQQLQLSLSEKIDHATQGYEEFGVLLESVLNETQQLTTTEDITLVRRRLMREIEKIRDTQAKLASTLHDTRSLLKVVDINNQKLNDELNQVRVLSLTDDLTRLPNRRAFIRRLEDEISRSQREHTPLTLALIDLDHFKNINDQHGHSIGDEILKCFADEILSIFRHYDMVARYGGEEFAVLLPNTSQAGALRAFNKVRCKAADTWYRTESFSLPMPSFSAGLAIHNPGELAKSLIERTDVALYRAKQSGRDRVELDESCLDETLAAE